MIPFDGRPGARRHAPLDLVVDAMRPVLTRAVAEPSSLSERAANMLADGPADALSLMRTVCRVQRLKPDAAARMADVLLGARADFVQLDDDRWALLRDGQVVHRDAARPGTHDDTGADPMGESTSDVPYPTTHTSARDDATLTLRSLSFAVVDVETTGSQAGRDDRITEIAIVPVVSGSVGEPWQTLVHPGRAIPPFISALTGITNEMVADAPRFHEIAEDVCARLGGHIFTAHNVSFDRRFVSSELARTCRTNLEGTSLCTVRLSRRLLPMLSRRSLDFVCQHFGIRITDRHRAGGDALATAHVLVRLFDVAEESGVTTWPQLQRHLSGPTRRTARRSAFPSPVREDSSA